MNCKCVLLFVAFILVVEPQQSDRFHSGVVIPEYGRVATVDADIVLDENTKLKLRFDVSEKSPQNSINRTFESAARFINLNVEAGAKIENIEVAIVVHGKAAIDVVNSEFYASKNEGAENPNVELIAELQKHSTTIYLCGQTAAWRGIEKKELLPSVRMAPSAMTAHALLDQNGFALCPF